MFFNSVLVAGLALVAFSCGQVSNDFDVAQLDAASAAPASKEFQMELKSDLNPGYGNAVYFAGTFSGNWQKAYRGTYSEEKGWTNMFVVKLYSSSTAVTQETSSAAA